jgi:putative ABC transport system substrate-binding protein
MADPVGTGLVASLGRPGGNVTGLSVQSVETSAKQLEFLRGVVVGLRRLAIIANPGSPGAVLEMRAVEKVAQSLGLDAATHGLRSAQDIAPAFDIIKGHADAFYLVADPLVLSNRDRIIHSALNAGLPAIYGSREYVDAGGLMSYGPNLPDLYRRAADFVDKQPTKFELVINLKTARALGLTIPDKLLALADEVIE